MDAATAFQAIRRGWYLVVVGVCAAVGAGVLLHATAAPYYETSATYIVSPVQDTANPDLVQESIRTLDDARSRAIVATFAEVLQSGSVHEEAVRTLGIDGITTDDYEFSSVILPEANVVQLTVGGPEAQTAVLLASSTGALSAERFSALYQIYDIVLLDAPALPTGPSNPSLFQTLFMAGALGSVAGAALALLWGLPRLRRERARQRRLLSYAVSEAPSSVVTPLHSRKEHRAAGSG
ncbi:MAG: hypothetical protein KQH83_06545 [Actinobacteria bacterium]|nr:hypothetical protein [Actinomycetota bacterium]